MNKPVVRTVRPIQIVDAIEPAIAFWAKLGFEKIVDVPHEGKLGFAILANGERHVMLQSLASVRDDVPEGAKTRSAIYLDVDSLDAAIEATKGAEVVVPRRKTAYGKLEIWLRDPSGVLVGISQSL